MKTIYALAAAALCISILSASAQESYPRRPVQIVNPYPAGSTTDLLARALADGLSARLGQQFVVLNRPGAGGSLGAASVARGDADGYTLLFSPALVISVLPTLRSDIGYEPSSLLPICQTFSNAMVIAVREDLPLRSLKNLIGAARENPGGVVAKLAGACEGAAKDEPYAAAARRAAQPANYYFDAATFRRNLQADIAEKRKVIDGLEQRP